MKKKNKLGLWMQVWLFFAIFMPQFAAASSGFSAGTAVPSAYAEDPMLELMAKVMFVVIMIGAVAVLGFGGIQAISHVFSSLRDAAREGDFTPLIRYITAAVVVITVAVVIAGLAWDWLSNSEFNPQVKVGSVVEYVQAAAIA